MQSNKKILHFSQSHYIGHTIVLIFPIDKKHRKNLLFQRVIKRVLEKEK